MTRDALPEKMSDLIDLALDDLEEVEKDDRYIVDMGVWHLPHEGVCHVCLAGSVMARTLDVDDESDVSPRAIVKKKTHGFWPFHYSSYEMVESFDESTAIKLKALEDVRTGDLEDAVVGLSTGNGHPPDRGVPRYEDRPEDFKKVLRGIAAEFRLLGM